MQYTTPTTGDQLASALHALGVNFVLGGRERASSQPKTPTDLLASLAQSDEARLRLSLIPLFLEHPEYAEHVCQTAERLDSAARLTLQCYYSAAFYLAQKYPQKNIVLTDYFSEILELEATENADQNLRMLAKRHKELSGSFVNWFATYQHAERVWRKGKVK